MSGRRLYVPIPNDGCGVNELSGFDAAGNALVKCVVDSECCGALQQSDSIVVGYLVAELHGAVSDAGHCVLPQAAEAAGV